MNLASAIDWLRRQLIAARPTLPDPPAPPKQYRQLERVTLTQGVLDTLFGDFARHRETSRGDEEFGWALLGVREEAESIALAALPAGAQRHASLTHIQFHASAQASATRLLRQTDKRLVMLGVVHTHPGSLRHPSGGDYRGDVRFVTRLRGREGVFGIGTADADRIPSPEPHQQLRGSLCFSWYVLAEGDDRYRPMPPLVTIGDDLAAPLGPVWPTLETHADDLERLCQQLAGVRLETLAGELAVSIPLAEENRQLRILLAGADARYYVESPDGLAAVDPQPASLDHGAYAILAELAKLRKREILKERG